MQEGAEVQTGTSDAWRRVTGELPTGATIRWIGRPCLHAAYVAIPLPNDQFSFLTSMRLIKTSSRRRPIVA